MNRDPEAWKRLGGFLRHAREGSGLTQAEAAERAGISVAALQDAENGRVPRARMPYTLAPLAQSYGWPAGTVDTVLEGGSPPGGEWRDESVDVDAVGGAIQGAIVRAVEHATAAEIREAARLAVEELRRQGVIRG
ncbi:helix-turn-helix domain-containing protein [Streptomyces sp. NPDC058442]|uniref:helix-turn-helix domain-containing protein n=1 Tax=Streptomyces sp. NPDC058442 TaxID=3346503 RepID=UPI00365AAC8C